MTDCTHHATLESKLRKIANSCDLGGLNEQFFLKVTFISDLANFVQECEREAYKRGMDAALSPK